MKQRRCPNPGVALFLTVQAPELTEQTDFHISPFESAMMGSPTKGETPMQAIQTTALTKRYKELTALDGLELQVRRGELFSLLGVTGAG